jgi:hypothetical protein
VENREEEQKLESVEVHLFQEITLLLIVVDGIPLRPKRS